MSDTSSRRDFLQLLAVPVVLTLPACGRAADESKSKFVLPREVTIENFSAAGVSLGKSTVPTVVKSDVEWRQVLSPLAYTVTRHEGTERPYSGEYNDHHGDGLYHCVCCDTPLFDSTTKFDSRTGWPSFTQPLEKGVVAYHLDTSYGMQRIETTCNVCDAHLGHVFPDGPPPSGLRFCINAVSLRKAKT